MITISADAPAGRRHQLHGADAARRSSQRPRQYAAGGRAQEKAILSGVALGELLETPVGADGSFTFGHLPKGAYLLSLFPTPPGMPSRVFQSARPTRASISCGRRCARCQGASSRHPLPCDVLVGFSTERSYVTATISADGSFSAQVQPARHTIELGGLPPGYSLGSARLGTQDVSKGVPVGDGDVSGLVITIAPPAHLPRLRGKVVGVPAASLTTARVELTGYVIGTLEASVQQDGSFEFPAVTPGTYRVRVPQVPELTPSFVVDRMVRHRNGGRG